jgi:hypothetical protein
MGTSLLSSGGAATLGTCKRVTNAHAKHTLCLRASRVEAGEMAVFCSMILFVHFLSVCNKISFLTEPRP